MEDLGHTEVETKEIKTEPRSYYGFFVNDKDTGTLKPVGVYIPDNVDNISMVLREAMSYFEEKYEDQGYITVHNESSLYGLGIYDEDEAMEWDEYKTQIKYVDSNPQVTELINKLTEEGISSIILVELKNDLDFDTNERVLRQYISLFFEDQEAEKTLEALDLAIKSHKGDTQKRPKDEKGLDSIPYSNHPIKVAIWAIELGLPAEMVQACLLHDVVEDTDVAQQYMDDNFSLETAAIVDDVTKKDEESREEYMERVDNLTNEYSKLLKCLDRYHNLLRGFGIDDVKYLNKYIREVEDVYLEKFEALAENGSDKLKKLFSEFLFAFEEFKKHRDFLQAKE